MSTIINAPLKSEYGFTSPSFTVDSIGNIVARSITLEVVEEGSEVAADFAITETGGNFRLDGGAVDNPGITLFRNGTKTIDIELTALTFSIFSSVGSTLTLYNSGLRHDNGTTGIDSQGTSSGRLFISLSSTAPDVLYYGNNDGTIFGTITVLDPVGLFSDITVTNTTPSTGTSSGALIVAGGAGIADDLYVGGSLNIAGVGIPRLDSPTNLELNAANKIILQIDNTALGEINSQGLTTTINNSTVVNSTINNTTIGNSTPSSAIFTSAKVTTQPTQDTDVTTKNYVDTNITALAIALGT